MTGRTSYGAQIVRIAGTFLVIVSVAVVVWKIRSNWASLAAWDSPFPLWLMILIGAVIYAVTSWLLPVAWIRLLAYFGQNDLNKKTWHKIYARTQIAKYLPGNIFHLASRHALGRQTGSNHGVIAGAAVFEAVGFVGSACIVSLLGFILSASAGRAVSIVWYVVLLAIAVVIPFIANTVAIRIGTLKNYNLPTKKVSEVIKSLQPVYLIYSLFLFGSGCILLWLVYLTSGLGSMKESGTIITVYAASWVAGFITPGAPAGLGVREALIVVSLSGTIGESDSLLVALIFRMITVAGDLIFFLSSFCSELKISKIFMRSGKVLK